MGWDVSLQERTTGKIMTLTNPFYKRGNNVRCALDAAGQLQQMAECEADLSITYNDSHYYYEASETDARFLVMMDGKEENGGLRAIHGTTPYESILMLCDLMQRIQTRYQDENGVWLTTKRTRTVYYDAHDNEIQDLRDVLDHHYVRTEEQVYLVNEGDCQNYWEATAANAIHSLQQMVHMAIDLLNEDCIWQIE